MTTKTSRPAVEKIGTVDEFGLVTALDILGRLHEGPGGFGVWDILDADGNVVHEGVASDRDAEWLAKSIWKDAR